MPFPLSARLRRGEHVLAAWHASASERMVEVTMAAPFDAAILDLQHGEATPAVAGACLAAACRSGKAAGARLSLAGWAEAARCLDFGAELVILPMVNEARQAARLVMETKYPPLGRRSYPPLRAPDLLDLTLDAYRLGANEGTLALAMIETEEALAAVEAILAVPGLDGVFVGPSDLSLSLSSGGNADIAAPPVVAALRIIAEACRCHGKIGGIYCRDRQAVARHAELGFRLLALGSDYGFLASGAKAAAETARETLSAIGSLPLALPAGSIMT